MKEKKLDTLQNKIRNNFLTKGVKMIAPETVFFSNDTKKGSFLKFWNWKNSIRFNRFFKSIK